MMEFAMFELTPAQRRALAATARGEVKRTYAERENVITAPKIGSKALWKILKDKLIEDGPREGNVVTMTLTPDGERVLQPMLPALAASPRPRPRLDSFKEGRRSPEPRGSRPSDPARSKANRAMGRDWGTAYVTQPLIIK
jgi:hypothetical protein